MSEMKFPVEEIKLPSKGLPYPKDNDLSSGIVKLKYPTAAQEDILASKNLVQKGIAIDRFIKSIFMGTDAQLDSMLLGDYDKIVVASRLLAYGTSYRTSMICPNCGKKSKIDVDIIKWEDEELDNKNLIEEGKNEFEFKLPRSERVIRYRLLTKKDEDEINKEVERVLERLGPNAASPELTSRYRRMIISVDGNSDVKIINQFSLNILALDSKALREEISRISPRVKMYFDFDCGHCLNREEVDILLDASFFWPSSNKRK